jgi:hypothetical protein
MVVVDSGSSAGDLGCRCTICQTSMSEGYVITLRRIVEMRIHQRDYFTQPVA